MNRFVRQVLLFSLSGSLVLALGMIAGAQTSRERSTKKARAAADQSARASRVFDQIMGTREKSIPGDLLDRAEAVAVFPGVVKGGFIGGALGGSGGISRCVSGGWRGAGVLDFGGG